MEDLVQRNLHSFARLYGFIRWFHPVDPSSAPSTPSLSPSSTTSTSVDWNSLAVQAVSLILSLPRPDDPSSLIDALYSIFSPIAPSLLLYPTSSPQNRSTTSSIPGVSEGEQLCVWWWKHQGLGTGNIATSGCASTLMCTPITIVPSSLSSPSPSSSLQLCNLEHQPLDPSIPHPDHPLMCELEGGVTCVVPLSLHGTATRPIPVNHIMQGAAPEQLEERATTEQERVIAAVIVAWNIGQHFYPYHDLCHTQWTQRLSQFLLLSLSSTITTVSQGCSILRRLISHLQDGHAYIEHPTARTLMRPPIWVEMVEDKLLVVGSSTPSIAIGERIETIDGEPVEQVIKKKSEEISAPSKQWCMWRLYGHSQLLAGISNSSVTLGLGNNRSVELKRTMSVYIGRERNEPHPPHLSELHPGVFYVDLCLITSEELNPTSPFMSLISERGRAFVCDIRGYPTGAALEFVRHLSSNDIIGVPCSTFTATRPDRVEFVEDAHTQFTMPPLQPKLDLHAVFMTSGRAISYAETLLAIIEHFKLGPIVGEPSAGTNGNLSKVQLPGGYTFSYTGLRVRKLDGSEQHCTGLQPTVHVSRTVRGVMEKRDEMLETALALVLKEIGN